MMNIKLVYRVGTASSGNKGHEGRPGEVGGSAAGVSLTINEETGNAYGTAEFKGEGKYEQSRLVIQVFKSNKGYSVTVRHQVYIKAKDKYGKPTMKWVANGNWEKNIGSTDNPVRTTWEEIQKYIDDSVANWEDEIPFDRVQPRD